MSTQYEDRLREAFSDEGLPHPLDGRTVVVAARRQRRSQISLGLAAAAGATAVLATVVIATWSVQPTVAGLPGTTIAPTPHIPYASSATVTPVPYVWTTPSTQASPTGVGSSGPPAPSVIPGGSARTVGSVDQGVVMWSLDGRDIGFLRVPGGWSIVDAHAGYPLRTIATYTAADFPAGAPRAVSIPVGDKRMVLIVAPRATPISLGYPSFPQDTRSYQVGIVSLDTWTAMVTTVDPGDTLYVSYGEQKDDFGYVIPVG